MQRYFCLAFVFVTAKSLQYFQLHVSVVSQAFPATKQRIDQVSNNVVREDPRSGDGSLDEDEDDRWPDDDESPDDEGDVGPDTKRQKRYATRTQPRKQYYDDIEAASDLEDLLSPDDFWRFVFSKPFEDEHGPLVKNILLRALKPSTGDDSSNSSCSPVSSCSTPPSSG